MKLQDAQVIRFEDTKNMYLVADHVIKTAPKDGTLLLCLDEIRHGELESLRLHRGAWCSLCRIVLAAPHEIGWVYFEGMPNDHAMDYGRGYIEPFVTWTIHPLIAGKCKVEMVDEFSDPDQFKNVGFMEGVPRPKLVEGKVVIYPDEIQNIV